ncbi:BadF/BadG/BcrA/BcrD ATPase family protein [Paenibacillus sp. GYB003]|uniref:BadF/BadG/BcrA/BcrD ATPase family protein n=1 Tax=Paenibacillus sp. GYB003 TaxID=2994392 RepID=UPI002F96DBFA
MIVLGVDGGQTATKACLYDSGSGRVWRATGPPIDHLSTPDGIEIAYKGISQTLTALTAKLGRPIRADAAVVGMSGITKRHEPLVRRWVREAAEVDRVDVMGDSKTNLAGATGGTDDGVLVIAGGGALGYIVDDEGRPHISGGWGHVLGDEGSAYWIGLTALRAAVARSDGRGEPTVLDRLLLDHFQAASFWQVKSGVHSGAIGRGRIAGLAALADRAADDGDAVARRIMAQAGACLGDLAVSVVRKVESLGKTAPRRIYPTGGVFRSVRWVKPAFETAVREADPTRAIARPLLPPEAGAALLAARLAGGDVTAALLRDYDDE